MRSGVAENYRPHWRSVGAGGSEGTERPIGTRPHHPHYPTLSLRSLVINLFAG